MDINKLDSSYLDECVVLKNIYPIESHVVKFRAVYLALKEVEHTKHAKLGLVD